MAMFNNRNLVVRALVGSHNYNLNTAESDEDYKYFVSPTFDDLYHGKFYSSANTSNALDYSVHDIRKLSELVWKANINFLEVLFSRDFFYVDGLGFLFEQRERWAAMNLPGFKNATYGMHLMKMHNLHKGTSNTKKLIEKFGYDTKEACHALRCLYTLEEYAKTESMQLSLHFYGTKRKTLLSVKQGEFTENEFVHLVDDWHMRQSVFVNDFYSSKSPDVNAMHELENSMYEFVKSEVKSSLDKNV